jgi:nucleoside-diphosphate-sugar epimerase
MKIFVTGANGFIGRRVTEALVNKGGIEVQACIMPNQMPHTLLNGAEIIKLDLFSLDAEAWKIQLQDVDILLHLAWNGGFNHHDKTHFDNMIAHFDFMSHVMQAGVKRLSVAGTMHEIGYHVGPVSSATPCNPLNPYGIAKNFLRQASFDLAKKMNQELQWLRFYYITGDDEFSNSIFSKLMKANKEGKKKFPLNSGEMLYDFIDIRDLAQQIANTIVGSETGILNCASGKPLSLRTRVELFIQENNLDLSPEYNVFPTRVYDSMAIWAEMPVAK